MYSKNIFIGELNGNSRVVNGDSISFSSIEFFDLLKKYLSHFGVNLFLKLSLIFLSLNNRKSYSKVDLNFPILSFPHSFWSFSQVGEGVFSQYSRISFLLFRALADALNTLI